MGREAKLNAQLRAEGLKKFGNQALLLPSSVRNTTEAPFFASLVEGEPGGLLPRDKEAHALWFYFSCAASNFKDEKEHIRYEGDKTIFNYHQLYLTIAKLYNVDPHRMMNYWPAIDAQARSMGLTLLPREGKYRNPGDNHAAVRPKTP